MQSAALVLAVLLGSAEAASERNRTEVLASGGKVTVRAERLPLNHLLDRIATATGMRVTYEGTRPSNLVSMDVENLSEVAAVLKLMEGLGVSYLLQTDATGEGVDLLIVSGSGAGSLVASNAPPAHVDSVADEIVPAYDHIPLDPAVLEAQGGEQPVDRNNPYMGLPVQHFPQAMTGPAPEGEKPAPPPQAPQFPHAASFPYR